MKFDFRNHVDKTLSDLVWDERRQNRTLTLIREEERPMKRNTLKLALVTALVCLTLTGALAAGLMLSPRVEAVMAAETALEADYGLTREMLTHFHRETEKLPDGSWLVTYEGNAELNSVLGKYSIVITENGHRCAWSHDGKDTSGGFDAKYWGREQLNEMLRIHRETHSDSTYTMKALQISEKSTPESTSAPLATPIPSAEGKDPQQDFVDRQNALAASSKLTPDEMIFLAREAVQKIYGLNETQMGRLLFVPEMSWYYCTEDGILCYDINFQLTQKDSADPALFPEHTEMDGIYTVTVNTENGAIENILYESALVGNG